MSTQINQKILTEFSLRTLDIDDSKSWGNDFKGKLIKLLTINNIEEFIYRNYIQKGEVKYLVTIIGSVRNNQMAANIYLQAPDTLDKLKSVQNKPKTIQLSFGDAIPPMYITESVIVDINNSKVYNQSPTFLTIKIKGSDYWTPFDRNIDAGFVTIDMENIRSRTQPNNAEYRQVYNELDEAIRKQQQSASVYYESAKKAIQARLSDPFYKDVKLGITLRQMGSERTEHFTTSSEGSDIELDITIGTSGSITIQHKVSEGYLSEYVPLWQQEVENRGLKGEIDVEELRKEVKEYFTSDALEKSMWQRFVLYVDATVGRKVGGYMEAIQATQKVTKLIWKEGVIPKDLWYYESNETGGEPWPKYMKMQPVIGGAIDGVIDEIVGLPMAVKTVYELATDESKRKALLKSLSSEGINQLYQGLKENVNETLNDRKKQQHFIGQSTVSVASMISGVGLITKTGKIDDVVSVASQGAEELGNIKVLKALEAAKKPKDKALRNAANEQTMKALIEDAGIDFIEAHADEVSDIAKFDNVDPTADVWKKLRERGQAFNRVVSNKRPPKYSFHEVEVEIIRKTKGKYESKKYRLDSYDLSDGGKIVSRKATDFDKIQLKTFDNYLLELKNKYPVGAKILTRKYPDELPYGQKTLQGKLYIEVPKSNETSKRLSEFQKLANERGVILIFEAE